MKKILFCTFALFFAVATQAQGNVDQDKRALIDELFEVTGALEVATLMSEKMVELMTAALRNADDDLPDRAYELLEEEVNSAIREEMEAGSFNELLYPIYESRFSKDEIGELIAFYHTDVGRKFVAELPQITQEGMVAGQVWGQRLGQTVGARVMQRLEAEGITVNE